MELATVTPTVSVVMAVRDGARWLSDAIGSVQAQSYQDWELIVIDDGSTDETPHLLAIHAQRPQLRDRMEVVTLPESRGLAHALNIGIRRGACARVQGGRIVRARPAPLIARLDADDWMKPTRLERQVRYLAEHPAVGLLGTAILEVDEHGDVRRHVFPALRDADLRRSLIRRNPFAHSSVVFRRWVWARVGGYDEGYPVAQDLDLWLRMAPLTQMANLAECLTVRRLHPGQVSARRRAMRRWMEARARWRAIRAGTHSALALPWVLRPLVGLAVRAS